MTKDEKIIKKEFGDIFMKFPKRKMTKNEGWEKEIIGEILLEHTKALITNKPFSYEFHRRIEDLLAQARRLERRELLMSMPIDYGVKDLSKYVLEIAEWKLIKLGEK